MQTAQEVQTVGGKAIPVICDHADDRSVETLFSRIKDETGRIDLLVNNAWGGYEWMFKDGQYTWELPFWEQPLSRWFGMFRVGVRGAFTASQQAARMMINQGQGLIVNISYWSAQKHLGNTLYGTAKAAIDKMTRDMAYEIHDHNIAVVSLYPGLVRSERITAAAEFMDLNNSESPQFIGRVIAGLFNDPRRMQRSGQVLVAAQLAKEYQIVDIDGNSPEPLTIEQA